MFLNELACNCSAPRLRFFVDLHTTPNWQAANPQRSESQRTLKPSRQTESSKHETTSETGSTSLRCTSWRLEQGVIGWLCFQGMRKHCVLATHSLQSFEAESACFVSRRSSLLSATLMEPELNCCSLGSQLMPATEVTSPQDTRSHKANVAAARGRQTPTRKRQQKSFLGPLGSDDRFSTLVPIHVHPLLGGSRN